MLFGFNSDKLSTKCQLCLQRMKIVRNRKLRLIQSLKAEVAEMMKAGQHANARIRVEEVIRQGWLMDGYTILETYVLLLQTRAGMLKKAKEPPPDMRRAVNTVFFAADRVKFELDEMPGIADMLMSKFQKALCEMYQAPDFAMRVVEEHTAMDLEVDPTVIAALSVMPASPAEKLEKLEEIAAEYDAPFDKAGAERELAVRNARLPKVTAPALPSPYAAAPGIQPYTVVAAAPAMPPATIPAPVAPPPPQPRPPPPPMPPPAAPPTRPPGPVKAPSTKDPWAPLPPTRTNLGYGFDDRLDTVAAFIAKRTTSAESGGGGSGLGPSGGSSGGLAATGSITSAMTVEMQAAAAAAAPLNGAAAVPEALVLEELLPEVPGAMEAPAVEPAVPFVELELAPEPPGVDAAPAAEATPPPAAADEEEDLLARLQRLRNL